MAILSKSGITTGNTILPAHVTQIIDSLTSSGSYTLSVSGSFGVNTNNPNAPLNVVGATNFGYPGVSSNSGIVFWPDAAFNSAYYIKNNNNFTVGVGGDPYAGTDVLSIDSLGNATLVGNNIVSGSLTVKNGITTLGSIVTSGGDITISSTYPRLYLTDTNNNSDFSIINDNGNFLIFDDTNSRYNFFVSSSGNIGINKYGPNAQLDVNGNVITTGSLTVTGNAYLNNITPSSQLSINGNTAVTGSLTATTLNTSTLNVTSIPYGIRVTGSSELTGSLVVDGDSTVTKTFSVYGNSYLDGAVNVDNNVNITGQLDTAYLNSTGDVIITGSLKVSSLITSSGDIRTNANANFRGGLIDLGNDGTGGRTAYISSNANSLEINRIESDPIIFSILNSEKVRITPSGYVGIGVSSPTYQLQLSLNSAAKPSTSTWTTTSDIRVKENIKPYTKGLNELIQINPVTYDYNGKAGFSKIKNNVGIIAQDIKDILPETISTYQTKLNNTDTQNTTLYNFDSHALTFVLINSIKEQQAQIEELKLQVATLISGSI